MNSNYLIILLNYNNWPDTVECIHSLKKCGVNDSNILVIENCSGDDSISRLRSGTPDVKIIQSEKNLGFTGGNNLGIKYALENKYDYAVILNNDTILEGKNSIQVLINEMEKNQGITIGTGRILYYPNKNIIWYDGGKLVKWKASAIHFNYRKNISNASLNDEIKEIKFVSGCYMCIRLKDFPRLGYMDENFFIYLDDLEYSARAIKKKLKLMYVPEAIIYHKAIGEEKRTPKMIYYTIRNRRLLINLHFGMITKIYFELAVEIKRFIWFFTNKDYYGILKQANKDYFKKYFGQAPEYIK